MRIKRRRQIRGFLYICLGLLLQGCTDGIQALPPASCDPISNEGCLSPEICRLVSGGEVACLPLESSEDTCGVGSCPAGEACLELEGLIRCARVCLDDGACGVGVCGYQIGRWGVCVSPCDLLSQCGGRGACAPIQGLPFPICIAEGAAAEGEPCGACQSGLGCLAVEGAPACQRLCTPELPGLCGAQACDGPIEGVDDLRYCRERR